jgi:hypothetical protein
MSTYYYLLNDTKKLRIHFDNHVKRGPIMLNPVVQYVLINYMFDNLGDSFRFVSDDGDEYLMYEEMNLSNYQVEKFLDLSSKEKAA